MASNQRYRGGQVEFVSLATDGTHALEEGDLAGVTGGYVLAAGQYATAAALKTAFAGVAVHKTGLQSGETSFRLTTDPGYNLVATTGDFEFPCAATSWANGDLVAAYVSGGACYPQQVAKTTKYDEAIGVAVVPHNALGTSMTSVIVRLRSNLMKEQPISGSGA